MEYAGKDAGAPRLVVPHGNAPRSSGYRPGALPLSYGRAWCSLQDSNLGMSVCGTDALAAWRSERARGVGGAAARKQEWCTREDLNLHAARAAASEAAASAVSPRVLCQECRDGAATADRTPVTALPKRCPATGRLRPWIETGAGWRTRTARLSLTRRVL